jgi:hypothetical protein
MRKLGRLPYRHDARRLLMAEYAASLPVPPPSCDWTEKVPVWGMMANDSVGDCTCAGAGHLIVEWTANAGGIAYPTDADILAAYSAITGYDGTPGDDTDQGANLLDVLNYWRKNGIAGHKIGAYMAVRTVDVYQVQQAVALLEGVYAGVQMPAAWQNVQPGQPWDIGKGDAFQAGSWDGHCVPAVAYDDLGVTVVTWGDLQKITWAAWTRYVDEGYAIVSTDELNVMTQLSASGLDVGQLQADLATL